MYMHWLKYVRLNRKDQLKNMWNDTGSRHASRRQLGAQCDLKCLPMCDWAPLT